MFGCISKRNKNQGALSLCPQLCQGVLDNASPCYQPEQAEPLGPFDHKLSLLMVATPVLL